MPLRVLHLEDDPNDRELVEAALHAHAIDCTIVQVAARDAFERALAERPDLILADYALPGFGGEQAQALARQRCPEVPFLFVSGSIGEEKALERLREGATDYVLKDHLDKLPMAVRRAVREAEDRRAREAAEAELRLLNAELEARVRERTRELVVANDTLEAARREADRANQAKSEFLSRMSHDLRTPLNAIMGFSMLLQCDRLTSEQRDSLTHIHSAGQHLLHLINEVLDIARIEADRLTLSPEPVRITEVLDGAVALMEPLAAQRQIALTACAPDHILAFADLQRLNQVLLNLLSNAVKYNRLGGAVRATAERRGDRVHLEVADTGAGIPADKLALLFVPFERLGAEQSPVEGTGLGLALAKRLTEAMGGSLSVRSVVDVGTVFEVELPASDGAAGHDAIPARTPDIRHDVSGTVLYVEDNASNAALIRRVLTRRPNVVLRHAPDGRTAIEMLAAARPDLIVLDLHLFDVPGEEVLRHVWENPATRTIPVVVLSGDATPGSRRRLLASGAFRYLTKPFEIAGLLQLVDEVLSDA